MQWAQFFRHQCKWEGWQQRSAESELRNPVSLASCYVSATYPHDPLRDDVMTAFLQSRPGPRRSLGGHLPIFRRHHHRENYPGARCHGGNATAGWSLMVVDGGSSLSVADALNVIYGDYPWESFCNQWNTSELMKPLVEVLMMVGLFLQQLWWCFGGTLYISCMHRCTFLIFPGMQVLVTILPSGDLPLVLPQWVPGAPVCLL